MVKSRSHRDSMRHMLPCPSTSLLHMPYCCGKWDAQRWHSTAKLTKYPHVFPRDLPNRKQLWRPEDLLSPPGSAGILWHSWMPSGEESEKSVHANLVWLLTLKSKQEYKLLRQSMKRGRKPQKATHMTLISTSCSESSPEVSASNPWPHRDVLS